MINVDGQIKKINMKPSGIDKSILLANLYNYLRFLLDSNQITKLECANYINEINDTYTYTKHFIQSELPQVKELLSATDKLNSLYHNILVYANKYPLFIPRMPSANMKELIKYTKSFFKYIDTNLYDLFMNIIDDDLLYEASDLNYGGICFNIGNNKSALVLRYDTYNLYKAFALVHEMGHAYYNYLNASHPNIIQSNIGKECISRSLEQLFFTYLRNNYLLNNNILDTYERIFHIHQLKITNSVYIVNKLLSEGQLSNNFYLSQIKPDLSYDEYQKLSIIKMNNPEYQSFLSYDNNYYAYAFMFSLIIKEKFDINEQETIKFIKNFPYYNRSLSTMDLILLFDKNTYLTATNKNTARILSKTHYKK